MTDTPLETFRKLPRMAREGHPERKHLINCCEILSRYIGREFIGEGVTYCDLASAIEVPLAEVKKAVRDMVNWKYLRRAGRGFAITDAGIGFIRGGPHETDWDPPDEEELPA